MDANGGRRFRAGRIVICIRRSRVVLTPRRWRQALQAILQSDGGKKARFTRESSEETVKTIRAGNAGMFRRTCGDYAYVLSLFARKAAGELGRPAFPAPSDGRDLCKTRVEHAARMRKCDSSSLRAIAKQSSLVRDKILDCFVAPAQNCFAILSRAPRNDEDGCLKFESERRESLTPLPPAPPAPAVARASSGCVSPSWSRRSAQECRPRTR